MIINFLQDTMDFQSNQFPFKGEDYIESFSYKESNGKLIIDVLERFIEIKKIKQTKITIE